MENLDDLRTIGFILSEASARDLGVSGLFLIWGVRFTGLDLKFTLVGSLWVTRRDRREGVCAGLPGVVADAVAPFEDVAVGPNEKEEIDAPISVFFRCVN